MRVALYAVAAVVVLSTLMAVGAIGRERRPVTASAAIGVVVVNAAVVTVMLMAAARLG